MFGEFANSPQALVHGDDSNFRVIGIIYIRDSEYAESRLSHHGSVSDPGSSAFMAPGSGIQDRLFPDP